MAKKTRRLTAELEALSTRWDSRAAELARAGYVTEVNLLDEAASKATELVALIERLVEIKED